MQNKHKLAIVLSVLILVIVAVILVVIKKESTLPKLNDKLGAVVSETKEYLNYTGSTSCDDVGDQKLQMKCFEAVNLAMNLATTSPCSVLKSERDIAVCQKAIFVKNVVASGDLSKCNEVLDTTNKIICLSQASLGLALASKEAKYCDNMAFADDKASCLKLVDKLNTVVPDVPADSDKDGLSDENEAKMGTNPSKSDTDGDGHSDGQEVAGGYNPCGGGRDLSDAKIKNDCAKY